MAEILVLSQAVSWLLVPFQAIDKYVIVEEEGPIAGASRIYPLGRQIDYVLAPYIR